MIFDYYCPKCRFVLEDYLTWTSEEEFMPCPKCGKAMIKRIPVVNVKIKNGTPIFYPNKKKEK